MDYYLLFREVARSVWAETRVALGMAFDRLFENPILLMFLVLGVVLFALWVLHLK